jgi:hypothetical protein
MQIYTRSIDPSYAQLLIFTQLLIYANYFVTVFPGGFLSMAIASYVDLIKWSGATMVNV